MELTRATARSAATLAAPARKGPRAGLAVHPREISFTAARRTIITTTRTGTATASLPPALLTASAHQALTTLARHRIIVDRNRHRPRKTKTRPGFPTTGPRVTTHTAPTQISLCGPQPPDRPHPTPTAATTQHRQP